MLTATRPNPVAYEQPVDTLVDRLEWAARDHPTASAVAEGSTRLDYAALLAAAGNVAAGLRDLGVRPGDRVITQLPNWWETVVASWAVFLTGAVLVPVVPIFREHELGFVLQQVEATAVLAPREFRGHEHSAMVRRVAADVGSRAAVVSVRGAATGTIPFAQLLERREYRADGASPADIAVVLFTSGTTADPKGALHSHQTLLAEARDVAQWCRLDGRETRVFMASPLSHITGLSYGIVLPADLAAGVVLQDQWDPAEAVDLIESARCTFTVSATPFLRGLAEQYADRGRSGLRTFVCGGADIPADLVRQARDVMGTTVLRTYGSTELPTSSMADPDGDPYLQATSEGRPMGRNEMVVRADADGADELLVRGPELFLGYLDGRLNEAAFTADGYFRTGDLASIADDGTVRITGRIKDVINRGGEKFSVAEVEAVLLTHPAVQDVAVVSYPDPVLVERACAYVVPGPGASPTVAELRDHVVAAGLAIQKAPEYLVLVPELPRTASGKVQRFRLREQTRSVVADRPSAGDR